MEKYFESRMESSKEIFEKILSENKDKKKAKKIRELKASNFLSDADYVYQALCILFNEDLYLLQTERNSEKDLLTMARAQESPVIWIKIDAENFAVIVDHNIILRYKTFESSLLAYVGSFSVFNISWYTIKKVCGTSNYLNIEKPFKEPF